MACSFLFSRRRLRLFYLLPKFPAPTSLVIIRHISTATPPSVQPDPKVSLSARLSFVFDQIDALERQRDTSAKDEALQRIRAWRQAKHPPPLSSSSSSATADTVSHGVNNQGDFLLTDVNRADSGIRDFFRREVELVHPWPEWIELMERLVSQNYFDYRRVEEERVAAFAGIDISGVKEEVGLDLTRDWAAVRTAYTNFGRDRFDILKSLSRKDIQVLVGHGCPNMDSKVVFSAKLLRKYVHIDEGDVCSSCSLRKSCSRGYILVPKEDEARTLDVMRILLTYGFDYIKESVENDPLKKMKSVKTVVRKLLHEVAKLSAIPRDPNLLPPVIKKLPPKVKQPPPQPKRRVGRDDIEMKKGDWLCPKCDFMNFAKNTVCLQCDAKRPKRQLLPGEWECPKCSFLNYRRNMSCFQCEHDRPPDEFTENQMVRKRGPDTILQKATRASDVSNAWNFDFDDDESDGADVAAFEFADSAKAYNAPSLNELPHERRNVREFEDDTTKYRDRGGYFSKPGNGGSSLQAQATGFDDFDDEDDNVDSYELDESNGEKHAIPRKSLSEFESHSESDDFDDHDSANSNHRRKNHSSDFDDDNDNDVGVSMRNIENSSRSIKYGVDKEPILNSDHDMHEKYVLNQRKKVQQNAGRKGFTRGRYSNSDEKLLMSSNDEDDEDDDDDDDDDDDGLYSNISKKKVIKSASKRMGRSFQDLHHIDTKSSRRNSFDSDDDETDDYVSHRSRNKGSRDTSESKAHRFHEADGARSRNISRNSLQRNGYSKFNDRGRSDFRSRMNQSGHGARRFQKTGAGFKENGYDRSNADHGYGARRFQKPGAGFKENGNDRSNADYGYRKNARTSSKNSQSRSFNDDHDFDDSNRRRRIIER